MNIIILATYYRALYTAYNSFTNHCKIVNKGYFPATIGCQQHTVLSQYWKHTLDESSFNHQSIVWNHNHIKNHEFLPGTAIELVYVAVPGRNLTLFYCVFRQHFHIQNCCSAELLLRAGLISTKRTTVHESKSTPCVWALPLMEVVLQHFERDNTVKIRNRIMFDFYPGLPHT